MKRRTFGRRAFHVAASLGLTSISLGRVGGLGLLGGCLDPGDLPPRGDGDPDAGVPSSEAEVSVLVIGSGYGSAVTALRLTEAGIPVTMLEAGRLWNTPGSDGKIFCKPFDPDGRAMWFQDRTETQIESFLGISTEMDIDVEAGVMEARGPADMRCYQGKGVGGGSLVNMALYLAPDREKLRGALPSVDPDVFFGTYLPRASAMLRAGSASPRLIASEFYRYSRVGMSAAAKAGFTCFQLPVGIRLRLHGARARRRRAALGARWRGWLRQQLREAEPRQDVPRRRARHGAPHDPRAPRGEAHPDEPLGRLRGGRRADRREGPPPRAQGIHVHARLRRRGEHGDERAPRPRASVATCRT